MDDHRSRVDSLDAELTLLRRTENHLKRKHKDTELQTQVHRGTPRLRYICLVLYVACSCDATFAGQFLSRERARKKYPAESLGTLERVIEDWFLQWPNDLIIELVEPGSDFQRRCCNAATRIRQELAVVFWVKKENELKGVAPSTQETCIHFDHCTGENTAGRSNQSLNRNRLWASRWRRRWGVGFGTVRLRDAMTECEIREKVLGVTAHTRKKPLANKSSSCMACPSGGSLKRLAA
jgi:hypothetical protein